MNTLKYAAVLIATSICATQALRAVDTGVDPTSDGLATGVGADGADKIIDHADEHAIGVETHSTVLDVGIISDSNDCSSDENSQWTSVSRTSSQWGHGPGEAPHWTPGSVPQWPNGAPQWGHGPGEAPQWTPGSAPQWTSGSAPQSNPNVIISNPDDSSDVNPQWVAVSRTSPQLMPNSAPQSNPVPGVNGGQATPCPESVVQQNTAPHQAMRADQDFSSKRNLRAL